MRYYSHVIECDNCGVKIDVHSAVPILSEVPEGWTKTSERNHKNQGQSEDYCNLCSITDKGRMNPGDFYPGSITWQIQQPTRWIGWAMTPDNRRVTIQLFNYRFWQSWILRYYVEDRPDSSLIELAIIAKALDEFMDGVTDEDAIQLRETFDDRLVEEQFVRLYFGIKKGYNYKYRAGIKTWIMRKPA